MARPVAQLRTTVRTVGPRTVLCVLGELDLATAAAMTSALERAAADGPADVVVDLSGLVFVDATGLSALLRGAEAVRGSGGTLCLTAPPRLLRRMLALLDLERELPVVDEV